MVLREYSQRPIGTGPFYDAAEARSLAATIADIAEVRVPGFEMPVRNLSGGNQQRLVARREMRISSKALVAAYPSRGLDIGAIATMHRYFADLRDSGVGVIVISEDLEELLNLSDRVAVLCAGRLMDVLSAEDASIERIGMLMGGKVGHMPGVQG
jgi:simple sugar transport system ATP-binding protein